MSALARPDNIVTLREVLGPAEKAGYAVGSFSPRYTPLIRPILRAGNGVHSPMIVQISQSELKRYGIRAAEFAAHMFSVVREEQIEVPVVLHLDHTRDFALIWEAAEAGFTSVMIDASDKDLEENVACTRKVVEYAHERGISVEAELGRIGTADFIETDSDEELYTNPEEAGCFVEQTGVDALAVSVGTAHGVYTVRQPSIDFERIKAIKRNAEAHLVLHGGSGVPPAMIARAVQLPGGGVSKVNIATDLELAALAALGKERMTDQEYQALSIAQQRSAAAAVEQTVVEKIVNSLGSHMQAGSLSGELSHPAARRNGRHD